MGGERSRPAGTPRVTEEMRMRYTHQRGRGEQKEMERVKQAYIGDYL